MIITTPLILLTHSVATLVPVRSIVAVPIPGYRTFYYIFEISPKSVIFVMKIFSNKKQEICI